MPPRRRERQRKEPNDVGRNGLRRSRDASCAMATERFAGWICAWDGYPRGQEEDDRDSMELLAGLAIALTLILLGGGVGGGVIMQPIGVLVKTVVW